MIVKGGFVHVAFALIKRITISNVSADGKRLHVMQTWRAFF